MKDHLIDYLFRRAEKADLMELDSLLEIKTETPDDVGGMPESANSPLCRMSVCQTAITRFLPFARRFLKFGFVGASGMVVDLGLYGLLLSAMPQSLARGLAIGIAMTWNFLWNRQVTFADSQRYHWLRQYVGYCASCLLGALVNWWTSLSVGELHPLLSEHPLVAAMLGVIAGMVFNFAFCVLIVFRPHTVETIAESPVEIE